MFNFSKLKLKERILLGYGVPLGLTVVATTLVIINAGVLDQQNEATTKGWLLVRDTDRLEKLLYKRQTLVRSYLITGDEEFWQQYDSSVEAYNEVMQSLETAVTFSTPEQAERLEELKRLGREIYAENVALGDLIRAKKGGEAARQFSQGRILKLVE